MKNPTLFVSWALGLVSAVVGVITVADPTILSDLLPKRAYGLAMLAGPIYIAVVAYIKANPIPGTVTEVAVTQTTTAVDTPST